MIKSSYLEQLFNLSIRKRIIRHMVKCIKKSGVKFNAIVFRGWSGALVAPEIATKLNVGLIGVRKDIKLEFYHGSKIEGWYGPIINYIILDDFIEAGDTMREIMTVIAKSNTFKHAICVAIFLHQAKPKTGKFDKTTFSAHKIYTVYNCGLNIK